MTVYYSSVAESRKEKGIDPAVWCKLSDHEMRPHVKPKTGAKKRVVVHHLEKVYANKKRKPRRWTVKETYYRLKDFEWVQKEFKADTFDVLCHFHNDLGDDYETMKWVSENIFGMPFEKTHPRNFRKKT